MSDAYARRGVSAAKEDVHFAIRNLDAGLYPRAFCKVVPDLLAGDPNHCLIMHADGAGTKSSLAYMYWKETGDISVWRGIAQDAIVMNLDDMACAGATGDFLFSNTIGRNKFLVTREVLSEILGGMEDVFSMLRPYKINAINTGGETADVGDLVRTIIFDATAICRMPRHRVITNEGIRAGDLIVGLASSGKATYETAYNSGISSNGLTLARHAVLDSAYAGKYPESFDPQLDPEVAYSGKVQLGQPCPGTEMNVGQALLSPTRTYLPLVNEVLENHRRHVHGMVHCTGGGQTKCLKFVEGMHIIKDNLFAVPPVFSLIQSAGGISWEEMYKVFNMGHRLEIYTDEAGAEALIEVSKSFGIDAQVVGRCEAAESNQLTLHTPYGVFTYS
jgi:phosphoribosylformylglycinamidine cyclo-ligase